MVSYQSLLQLSGSGLEFIEAEIVIKMNQNVQHD